MTTRSEIEAFMAAAKNTVVRMNWREKLTKSDPQWWEYVSAVEVDGVVVEDVQIIVQWRPSVGAAGDKYNCALLYRSDRVYAVDFDPDGQHTNKVGKGRALYRKQLGPGTHEHTWSEDGYGYAEPILPDFTNFSSLFDYFCQQANLTVESGFKSPPSIQLNFFENELR